MGAKQSTPEKDAASQAMLLAYLERIGFAPEEAALLAEREPNAADLRLLLRKQMLSLPFENLGQHTHPASGGAVLVPRGRHVPSLDVHKTLKKLIFDRRGGFCFELNFAFAWLLRTLNYKVRAGLAAVLTPGGPLPGHLCLFVDGLGSDALMVDPGFGDAPRVPMAVTLGAEVTDDMIGDAYLFEKNDDASKFQQTPDHLKRYDTVLYRRRNKGISSSPMVDFAGMETPPPASEMGPPEAVYLLNTADDLALDSQEFKDGLAGVLVDAEQNPFSQKRMVIMVRENGFDFVGEGYRKEVRDGKETSRVALADEAAYRRALKEVAGIALE